MFGKDLVVADRSANPGSVALSCESTLDAGDPPVIPSKKDASGNQSQQCTRKKACQDSGADDQKKETVFMEGQSATRCNGPFQEHRDAQIQQKSGKHRFRKEADQSRKGDDDSQAERRSPNTQQASRSASLDSVTLAAVKRFRVSKRCLGQGDDHHRTQFNNMTTDDLPGYKVKGYCEMRRQGNARDRFKQHSESSQLSSR